MTVLKLTKKLGPIRYHTRYTAPKNFINTSQKNRISNLMPRMTGGTYPRLISKTTPVYNQKRNIHYSLPVRENYLKDLHTGKYINGDYYSKKTNKKEVTLYVKGFLQHENRDAYDGFLNSHEKLIHKNYKWDENAIGYFWDSGKTNRWMTTPIVQTAWEIYKNGVLAFKKIPLVFATTLTVEGFEKGLNIWKQYKTIKYNLPSISVDFGKELKELTENFDKVRIVAHSLGCELVMESLNNISLIKPPSEIHFCGGSFREKRYINLLQTMYANNEGKMFVYYSDSDYFLTLSHILIRKKQPVGVVGLKGIYPNIYSIDVTDKLGLFPHSDFKNNFSEYAINSNNLNAFMTEYYRKNHVIRRIADFSDSMLEPKKKPNENAEP